MIKVSVMYPNTPGVWFDHDYYRRNHLPLIKSRMGAALNYYTIDKGLVGGTPDAPAVYVAACHLLCDSVEVYRSHLARMPRRSRPTSAISPTKRRSSKSVKWSSRTRPKPRAKCRIDSLTRWQSQRLRTIDDNPPEVANKFVVLPLESLPSKP